HALTSFPWPWAAAVRPACPSGSRTRCPLCGLTITGESCLVGADNALAFIPALCTDHPSAEGGALNTAWAGGPWPRCREIAGLPRIEYVRLLKVLKVCEPRLDTVCVQCVLTFQAIVPLSPERGVQWIGFASCDATLRI